MELSASGALELSMWHDIGGSWGSIFSGFYLVESGVLYSNIKNIHFSYTSFDQGRRLLSRQLQSTRVWVPEEFVNDFDRLSGDTTLSEDSLHDALIDLRFFMQDAG
jgi:hypothetical protein